MVILILVLLISSSIGLKYTIVINQNILNNKSKKIKFKQNEAIYLPSIPGALWFYQFISEFIN